jgi:hypothetical protein
MTMNSLILSLVQERLLASLKTPIRPWTNERVFKERGILLCGQRGIGKTSFLLRKAAIMEGR